MHFEILFAWYIYHLHGIIGLIISFIMYMKTWKKSIALDSVFILYNCGPFKVFKLLGCASTQHLQRFTKWYIYYFILNFY